MRRQERHFCLQWIVNSSSSGMYRVKTERLSYVNHLMDELHSCLNSIYEDMIDEDYAQLDLNLKDMINKIEEIQESFDDKL